MSHTECYFLIICYFCYVDISGLRDSNGIDRIKFVGRSRCEGNAENVMETDTAVVTAASYWKPSDDVLLDLCSFCRVSWILHVVRKEKVLNSFLYTITAIYFRFPQVLSLYYNNKDMLITTCMAVDVGFSSMLMLDQTEPINNLNE